MTSTQKQPNEQELPEGWSWSRLKNVTTINPRRPLGLERLDSAETTFVPMEAVDSLTGKITNAQTRLFSDIKTGYTFFCEGDVLFAKITPCMQNGKHCIARGLTDGIGFGTTEFHVLRPGPDVISEWLHFFLRQPYILQDAMNHFTGAVGQQRVPTDYLAFLEIPLPPLEEQKQIVEILSKQMTAVGRVRKAAEKQLETAQALFASYLRQIFCSTEAEKWKSIKLGSVCDFIGGMQPPKHTFRYEKTPGYVRLVQIQDFRLNDVAVYIPEKYAKRTFGCEDVMIGRYGPPVFQILRGLEGSYNVALMKASPREGLSKRFLFYLLQEENIQRHVIDKSQRSAGQSGVQKPALEQYTVKLPNIETQEKLAFCMDNQSAGVQVLIENLEAQLREITSLPATLLRCAFTGDLTN